MSASNTSPTGSAQPASGNTNDCSFESFISSPLERNLCSLGDVTIDSSEAYRSDTEAEISAVSKVLQSPSAQQNAKFRKALEALQAELKEIHAYIGREQSNQARTYKKLSTYLTNKEVFRKHYPRGYSPFRLFHRAQLWLGSGPSQ